MKGEHKKLMRLLAVGFWLKETDKNRSDRPRNDFTEQTEHNISDNLAHGQQQQNPYTCFYTKSVHERELISPLEIENG